LKVAFLSISIGLFIGCQSNSTFSALEIASKWGTISSDSSEIYFSKSYPHLKFHSTDTAIFWVSNSAIPRIVLMTSDGSISNVPFCNKYFPGFAAEINNHEYPITNNNWLRESEKACLMGLKTKDTTVFAFLSATYGDWNAIVLQDLQQIKPSLEVIYFNLEAIEPPLDSGERFVTYAAQQGNRNFFPN
jgi:hypothetical protein